MSLNDNIELPDDNTLEAAMAGVLKKLAEKISIRNEEYYDAEFDKLELYAEETLMRMHDELKEKEDELAAAKRKRSGRLISKSGRKQGKRSTSSSWPIVIWPTR